MTDDLALGNHYSPTGCATCNSTGRVSLPNSAWTPATLREASGSVGPHGRPIRICEACNGRAAQPRTEEAA